VFGGISGSIKTILKGRCWFMVFDQSKKGT
jgi:hypothetical protein